MSARPAFVSDLVRRKATEQGALGLQWLEHLDALLDAVTSDWGLSLGPTLAGGTDAYVAEVETQEGMCAVLKLGIPSEGEGVATEIRTLELAGGRGYASLLRHDVARNALLLERLGPKLSTQALSVEAQIGVICATLEDAWAPVPAGVRLPTGGDKAASLARFIRSAWAELDHPCSARVVARALSYADRRGTAFDPASAVLVHGDAHAANTLLSADVGVRARYKFVDPDGLFAERAYDLAIPMREWAGELLAGDAYELGRARCLLLSRLTDVDPVAIWEWGFIERVSTGLLLLKVGEREWGCEFLAVAEEWAAGEPFG